MFALSLLFFPPVQAEGEKAEKNFSRKKLQEYSVRRIGRLSIRNARGKIRVRGFSLNRIRIEMKKRAQAKTQKEADRLFETVELQYRNEKGRIEIFPQYGVGLEMKKKQKKRKNPQVKADLTIYAPVQFGLKALTQKAPLVIDNWKGKIEARSGQGKIRVRDVQNDSVLCICQNCKMDLNQIGTQQLKVIGYDKRVKLASVRASRLYVETREGAIYANQVEGEQHWVTSSGELSAHYLTGSIQLGTDSGDMEVQKAKGRVNYAQTESGDIFLDFAKWSFNDQSILESQTGDIKMQLPPSFQGALDLKSLQGKTLVEFPLTYQGISRKKLYGPFPQNRTQGAVGNAELGTLRIRSNTGQISLLKRP